MTLAAIPRAALVPAVGAVRAELLAALVDAAPAGVSVVQAGAQAALPALIVTPDAPYIETTGLPASCAYRARFVVWAMVARAVVDPFGELERLCAVVESACDAVYHATYDGVVLMAEDARTEQGQSIYGASNQVHVNR